MSRYGPHRQLQKVGFCSRGHERKRGQRQRLEQRRRAFKHGGSIDAVTQLEV